jgi:hypothetical protein
MRRNSKTHPGRLPLSESQIPARGVETGDGVRAGTRLWRGDRFLEDSHLENAPWPLKRSRGNYNPAFPLDRSLVTAF